MTHALARPSRKRRRNEMQQPSLYTTSCTVLVSGRLSLP
jgi:hypothetical protein